MFRDVWEQYHWEVCRFICRKVNPVEDAEDILQDVFTRAYANWDDLRDSAKVRAWLYRIARNAVVDHYRARYDDTMPLELVAHRLPDKSALDDDAAVQSRLDACIRELVSELPETYREAVTASELWDISQTALAQQLGLSYSGVKSRVQRGRKHLRDRLQAECAELLAAYPTLELHKNRYCTA